MIERLKSGEPRAIAAAAAAVVVVLVLGTLAVRGLGGSDSKASRPAEQTAKKLMWGPAYMPDGGSVFPTMRDLGVGIFGIQARWEEIAPREPDDPTDWRDPAYEWPQYLGDMIREAHEHGMKVQLMLMGAPKWANGGRPWNWAPRDPRDFGDFATAISNRYRDVRLWMVWGEPNREPNFSPLTPAPDATAPDDPLTAEQQVAPRNYAQMLESAYEALKRQDPDNLVIGGNTYTSAGLDNIRPYQWIRYMVLPDGSRPRMDMWGHNPWGNRRPDLSHEPSPNGTVSFSDLGRLAEALDEAFPGRPLKLYLAEWGVPTGFEDVHLGQEETPETADKWIRSAFAIADWKRIYTLGWIHLLDKDGISTGLLTKGGERKSTYGTYKRSD
ncbi:MAG: hypothetical protein FJW90_01650 [Actinobacteria bacterium]|nr:hypothetical protein [Actinomycetota bacterium]